MLVEITKSINGAWRIARMDQNALNYFNMSVEGFWRSFLAVLIVLPLYVVFLVLNLGQLSGMELPTGSATSKELYVAIKLAAHILGWLAFPIVMIPISRLMDLSQSYVPYIIVWNWSNVLVMAVILPAVLLFPPSAQSGQSAKLILMAAQITVLFYGYLVARAGLQCKILTAIGVVMLDLLLGLLFNLLAGRLL